MKNRFGAFLRQRRPGVRSFWRLLGDSRGSIAVLFAFTLTVLLVAAGTAIDGMRYFMMRSELRVLADSAAVAAGANPANNTQALLQSVATNYVNANANPRTAGAIVITSEYKRDTQEFTLKLTSGLPATFLQFAGIETLTASVTAEVLRALPGPIEMALALDMTISMFQPLSGDVQVCPTVNPLTNANDVLTTKLDVLRCAFTTLILDLSVYVTDAATERGRNAMKIGAVPFAAYANVGMSYTTADWLSGLTQIPGFVPDPTRPGGLRPVLIPWSGCVGYRQDSLRASLANPTANKYPRVSQGSYPYCQGNENRIVPLRSIYSVDDRKAILESLTPSPIQSGSVLPSGILWAWQLLNNESTTAPSSACDPDTNASLPISCNPIFKGARSFEDMNIRKGRKVVVLFTDGWNTWGPREATRAGVEMGSFKDRADTDMANLCRNIKNAKIELFVVSFQQIRDGTEIQRLRDCAEPGKFIEATSASQLIAAFRNIAVSFRPVRLTQ